MRSRSYRKNPCNEQGSTEVQSTCRRIATGILAWAAFAIALDFSLPLEVEAQDYVAIDAEAIIAHCWEISLEKRSTPVNAVMREGHIDTALCLEEAIVENAAALVEQEVMSRDQITATLESAGFDFANFFESLFISTSGCAPICGTMWHVLTMNYLALSYEVILRDVISLRNENRL